MICRLCLIEINSGIKILEDGDETEVFRTIVKYFNIELQPEAGISNEICTLCWQQIEEFHRFWLDINEKQKTLQTHLETIDTKHNIEEINYFHPAVDIKTEDTRSTALSIDESDCGGLQEPQIDLPCAQADAFEERIDFDAVPLDNVFDAASTDEDCEDLLQPSPTLKNKKNPIKAAKTKKSLLKAEKTEKTTKRKYIKQTLKSKSDDDEYKMKQDDARTRHIKKMALIAELDAYIAENCELDCCLCKEKLTDFPSLRRHFREQHNCEGYMSCCNNRFLYRHLWVDHLRMHKEPGFLRCDICNKKLRNRNTYQFHMDTKHPDAQELQFQCKLCPRKFVKQALLNYHMKTRHTTTRNHVCKTCNKGFVNAAVLKTHERNMHSNEYDSVCEICGKGFKMSHNLARHIRTMHNESTHTLVQCQICGKWLKNAESLKKHIIAHREKPLGKKYPCLKCDAVKNSRQCLASHIRYHHSDKRFKCLECGREFKLEIALKEHRSIHEGIHLYSCSICAKKYRSHRNLRKHIKKNHSKETATQPSNDQAATDNSTILLPIQNTQNSDLAQ